MCENLPPCISMKPYVNIFEKSSSDVELLKNAKKNGLVSCMILGDVRAHPDLTNEICMFLGDVKSHHDFEVEVTWLHIRLSAVTYPTATDREWEEK